MTIYGTNTTTHILTPGSHLVVGPLRANTHNLTTGPLKSVFRTRRIRTNETQPYNLLHATTRPTISHFLIAKVQPKFRTFDFRGYPENERVQYHPAASFLEGTR